MGGIDHKIWRCLEVLELIYGRVKLGQRRFLTSSYGRVKRKGSKLLSIRFPPKRIVGLPWKVKFVRKELNCTICVSRAYFLKNLSTLEKIASGALYVLGHLDCGTTLFHRKSIFHV